MLGVEECLHFEVVLSLVSYGNDVVELVADDTVPAGPHQLAQVPRHVLDDLDEVILTSDMLVGFPLVGLFFLWQNQT